MPSPRRRPVTSSPRTASRPPSASRARPRRSSPSTASPPAEGLIVVIFPRPRRRRASAGARRRGGRGRGAQRAEALRESSPSVIVARSFGEASGPEICAVTSVERRGRRRAPPSRRARRRSRARRSARRPAPRRALASATSGPARSPANAPSTRASSAPARRLPRRARGRRRRRGPARRGAAAIAGMSAGAAKRRPWPPGRSETAASIGAPGSWRCTRASSSPRSRTRWTSAAGTRCPSSAVGSVRASTESRSRSRARRAPGRPR